MLLYVVCVSLFIVFLLFVFLCVPQIKLGVYLFGWDFLGFKLNVSFNRVFFSIILLVVRIRVLYYSLYYLNGEINFYYYIIVLLIFIGSMFGLVFANSAFTIIVCWDLLGVSRFFLVLYYNNWDSCSGSINTVITNRLGDYFIFIFFALSFFNAMYFFRFSLVAQYFVLFLLLAAFTKSAQFPFSGWLPKAIRAPTPVSALVHSSTLVTAGLVLMMNFNLINLSVPVQSTLCWIGLFTMFFRSIAALVEADLKKVVALSTLSQIGFRVLTLGLGLNYIALVHLLRHALFKSCLFIQVGYLIHCSYGQQDSRNYNGMGNVPYFIQLQLLVTLFCLCGLFFTSGRVSKDLILELFFRNTYSMLFAMIFFVSVFLTFCYSYRLWSRLFNTSTNPIFHYRDRMIINFVRIILTFMSIAFMWWFNINFLCVPALFLYVDQYVPIIYIILACICVRYRFKFLTNELVYKFLADYTPILAQRLLACINSKVVEMFLYSITRNALSYLWVLGRGSSKYIVTYINSVVFAVFVLFIVL